MFRKLFSRSHSGSRSARTHLEVDFKAGPAFTWSLDFRIGDTMIAETHSPSPFALISLAEEIDREQGIPGPPAELRLRHLASGRNTRLEPGAEESDPTDVVRRARPNWRPGSLIETATRTTLTSPDGQAISLGDVLARMREAAAELASRGGGSH